MENDSIKKNFTQLGKTASAIADLLEDLMNSCSEDDAVADTDTCHTYTDAPKGATPDGFCTMCGKKLNDFDLQEGFGLNYDVGYGSRHDLERVRARFCCECFDKLLDHVIIESKFNPVVGTYA